MLLGAALTIAALGVQAEKDYSRILPVYSRPAALVSKPGERFMLASFMPSAADIPKLTLLDVSLFVAETDKLGPPVSAPGQFDWETLQAQREAAKAAGAKWGVNIFTTFPNPDSLDAGEGAIEALTGARLPAWSLWNQERIRWSANRYGAVNRAFPKLDWVSLGVSGEYGDASFFTGLARRDERQVALWQEKLRVEPPALGFWSADEHARASWKRRLEAEYGSVADAFKAWGMEPPEGELIPFPLDASYPYSARVLYMDWYRDAPARAAASLSEIAREIFVGSPILVPVGPPTDQPQLGLDAYALSLAVKDKADALKVTNLGYYDFATDWAMSQARIRGAARAADVPLWTEAPLRAPADFQLRIFESLSLGSRGHLDWPLAYMQNSAGILALQDGLFFEPPHCDLALLHPTTSHLLSGGQAAPPLTFRAAAELRDYADFDELEESAVIDGALRKYRVAAVLEGTVWDAKTLAQIKNWVAGGGVLLAYDFGKMADTAGSAAVYQELFGFASSLAPAKTVEVWLGEVPPIYEVDLAGRADSEFLLGNWGTGAAGSRPAANGAVLRLPVRGESGVIVSVVFGTGASKVKQVEFSSGGKLLAGVSLEGGLRQFRFSADRALLSSGVLNLTIGGLEPGTSVPIDSVVISEPEAEGAPVKLAGRFEAPVEISQVKAWAHEFGKGLVIFFPGKRDQWKQFISVVRHAVYRLSSIAEGREDAPAFDDVRDGVYVTWLGGRLAVYNSSPEQVTRVFSFGGAQHEVALAPGSLRFIFSAERLSDVAYEFESAVPQGFQAVESARASPGTGPSAVRVSPGQTLAAEVAIPRAGRYRVYARTLRSDALVPVSFRVGSAESSPSAAGTGDFYLVGEFELEAGPVPIAVFSDGPFLADALIFTQSPAIRGYRFGLR